MLSEVGNVHIGDRVGSEVDRLQVLVVGHIDERVNFAVH